MKIRRAAERSERRLEELREQAWRAGRVEAPGVRPSKVAAFTTRFRRVRGPTVTGLKTSGAGTREM